MDVQINYDDCTFIVIVNTEKLGLNLNTIIFTVPGASGVKRIEFGSLPTVILFFIGVPVKTQRASLAGLCK